MVCISTAHCSQGSVFQINQSDYLCAAACQLLSCHPHMLWNSRTRSRVLALGNARGVARSSCRLPKLWDHVVSHSIKAGSSLPLFVAQLASQCSLDFPLLWYGTVSCGHACSTNESASTCTLTHGTLHLRSQTRGFLSFATLVRHRGRGCPCCRVLRGRQELRLARCLDLSET